MAFKRMRRILTGVLSGKESVKPASSVWLRVTMAASLSLIHLGDLVFGGVDGIIDFMRRHGNQIWVFGMVDASHTPGLGYMEVVPSQDANALLAIIQVTHPQEQQYTQISGESIALSVHSHP